MWIMWYALVISEVEWGGGGRPRETPLSFLPTSATPASSSAVRYRRIPIYYTIILTLWQRYDHVMTKLWQRYEHADIH